MASCVVVVALLLLAVALTGEGWQAADADSSSADRAANWPLD